MTVCYFKGHLYQLKCQWNFLDDFIDDVIICLCRKLEKHTSHVAKLHETLEGRIMARHNEL